MNLRVLLPSHDAPIHGQRHHENQAIHSVRTLKLCILKLEAARFEIGEHRFDAPACTAVEYRCCHCGGLCPPLELGQPRLRDDVGVLRPITS